METVRTRIRKNDIVQVVSGRGRGKIRADSGQERGKRGKVLEVDKVKGRAKVQGLKMVFRHLKQSKDPQKPGGGRIEREAPIALANLIIVCPKCDEATRIGVRMEKQERDGGKIKTRRVRVCKKCGADILDRD
ncbi:MAG: 50S ribosomal protein L24 [Planctomycetota bacterium]|jgi:large subunit ribosomal protein L24|nr:50S ribosomal protein L24 [Planctomycetota bacterium]